MSTRAIYTFKGFGETYHVFKHHDGYPSGAAGFLEATLTKAWDLPRYEPDEFACAFIAANKTGSGDLRLARSRTSEADVEFGYTISPVGKPNGGDRGFLHIRVVATDYWDGKRKETLIWQGGLMTFIARAAEIQKEYYEE